MLNIKYPIIQGGMAWIADADLAVAVTEAGGLGIIAAGNAPADIVYEQVLKAKKMTDKPFGVNIMLLSPYVKDIVNLVCDENISVVTTGAGNPGIYIDKLKQKNIKLFPVVPSVALAKRMEKIGADAVIAEGMEAGGHIGKLTSFSLIPQIAQSINIPVIAAGGIATGESMAAAFTLGAAAVQLGTRFLVAHECNVHKNYKLAILKAKDIDTTITGRITGHPVRVIRNKLSKALESLENNHNITKEEILSEIENLSRDSLRRAVKDGDVDNGSIMAGQIASIVKKEQSCNEIIQELISEFNKTIIRIHNDLDKMSGSYC
jgi:enoyl-[acyl-carrier protein] reductase II